MDAPTVGNSFRRSTHARHFAERRCIHNLAIEVLDGKPTLALIAWPARQKPILSAHTRNRYTVGTRWARFA